MVLLDKLSDPTARLWYATKASENGWSRKILRCPIPTLLHI